MAKKHRTKRAAPRRSATRRATPPAAVHDPMDAADLAAQGLMVDFRRALREDDPLAFVGLVSGIIEIFGREPEDLRELLAATGPPGDPQRDGPPDGLPDDLFDGQPPDGPPDTVPFSLAGIVETFAHTNLAETTAALTVIAELTDDELVAARARRAAATRRQPLPRNIAELATVRVDEAHCMSDELDDGSNLLLGLTWPDRRRQSAVVYIDNNLAPGSPVVKDAFLVDQDIEETVAMYRRVVTEAGEGGMLQPLDPADARAMIEEALAMTETDLPTPEEDDAGQWPQCRPFVRFLMGRLPSGGSAERTPYEPLTLADAVAGFLHSPYAAGLGEGTPGRDAVELLLRGAQHRVGHPLRWSGITVAVLLLEELPWDEAAPEDVLDAVPQVIEPVIRYAHGRYGVSARRTQEILQGVAELLPEYATLRQLDVPGELRRGNAELAAMLAGDLGPFLRRLLIDCVGSEEALAALTAAPLPAEAFDLEEVPEDVRGRVAEVVSQLDRFVEAHESVGFDAEFRTAAYRFLAAVTERSPALWRRAGRADSAAAAIIWAVGRANDLLGVGGAPLTVKEMLEFFGLSASPAQRAGTMLKALGLPPRRFSFDIGLGDPAYLTSATRARIIAERDSLDADSEGRGEPTP